MYLSNRDIKWAIDCGKLIVNPRPEATGSGYDETSIDLRLACIDAARIWDLKELKDSGAMTGAASKDEPPELHMGSFDWRRLAEKCLIPVPVGDDNGKRLVYRRDNSIVVKQFGFVLWTTKEEVGTPIGPKDHPELICFVNAKSTKARTGLMVHFTAPTIHAGWTGNVTLEITNLGPFTFILKENDALAQLTVATISSAPDLKLKAAQSLTQKQVDPSGTTIPSK